VFKNNLFVVYDGRKNLYAPSPLVLGGKGATSFEDTVEILEVPEKNYEFMDFLAGIKTECSTLTSYGR